MSGGTMIYSTAFTVAIDTKSKTTYTTNTKAPAALIAFDDASDLFCHETLQLPIREFISTENTHLQRQRSNKLVSDVITDFVNMSWLMKLDKTQEKDFTEYILSAVRRFNQIEEKIHNNENLALESGLWAAVALSYAHTIHHHYPYVYLDRCKLFVGGFRMAHKTYASRIISDRVLRHIFGTAKKPAAALEWKLFRLLDFQAIIPEQHIECILNQL